MAKKRRIRGKGRKIQGLSPHITPPPASAPPATSTPVPAVQSAVFPYMDCRPQYRQVVLRGLQSSQSGSGDHPSSPAREKQRMLPPSTPAQDDLQDHLAGRHQQTYQGGSSAFSRPS